jgi:hypothetical protein
MYEIQGISPYIMFNQLKNQYSLDISPIWISLISYEIISSDGRAVWS